MKYRSLLIVYFNLKLNTEGLAFLVKKFVHLFLNILAVHTPTFLWLITVRVFSVSFPPSVV